MEYLQDTHDQISTLCPSRLCYNEVFCTVLNGLHSMSGPQIFFPVLFCTAQQCLHSRSGLVVLQHPLLSRQHRRMAQGEFVGATLLVQRR